MSEKLKQNEGIGFTYAMTMEQMQKHAALPPEAILEWIQQTATFIYDLQTPEERERKYLFKPNKKTPQELLRKDD